MEEITRFNDRNFDKYFAKYKTMINSKNHIRMWLDEKKRTMPDWHEYGYDSDGNILYRFLLDKPPQWELKFPMVEEKKDD